MWESTALMLAVENRDAAMVRILLDGGADPAQTARIYGGPRPDPAILAHDPTRYGLAYYSDNRARLTVYDLLAHPPLRSNEVWEVFQRHPSREPLLEPRGPARFGLWWALLAEDPTLVRLALDRGVTLDAAGTERVWRHNLVGLDPRLTLAAGFGATPLPAPTRQALEALGRVSAVTDHFWYESILGPGLEAVDPGSAWRGALAPAFSRVMGPREADFYQAWDFLSAQPLGRRLLGDWTTGPADRPWTLEIRGEYIRHHGTNQLSMGFIDLHHPWRLALEETIIIDGQESWPVRVNTSDHSWVYLSLDQSGLVIRRPDTRDVVRMNRTSPRMAWETD